MRRVGIVLAALSVAMLLGACGGSDGDDEKPTSASSSKAAGDDRVFPGGQPLSSYKDSPTYAWRVAIVDHQAELDEALKGVGWDDSMADFDESVYGYVVGTCDDIARGASVLRNTELRWTRDPAKPVAEPKARKLIAISKRIACPS